MALNGLWGRSPRTPWGTLTDGNFEFDGVGVHEIRRAINGSNFRLLKSGGTGFNTYFATGGGGEDARFYIITESINIDFDAVANIRLPSGGNFFNFDLLDNAGWRSALTSIGEGDRFIMGWTVPAISLYKLRAAVPVAAPFITARVSHISVRRLRAAVTVPAPSITARVSRVLPDVRRLRAAVTLPVPSITARVSRIAVRRLRASVALSAPYVTARVSRIPAAVRKLRASVTLPAPSITARVSRHPSYKLRGVVPVSPPIFSARVSRLSATVRKLRAAVTLPAPSFTARLSHSSSGSLHLRAAVSLPVPFITARVSRIPATVHKSAGACYCLRLLPSRRASRGDRLITCGPL